SSAFHWSGGIAHWPLARSEQFSLAVACCGSGFLVRFIGSGYSAASLALSQHSLSNLERALLLKSTFSPGSTRNWRTRSSLKEVKNASEHFFIKSFCTFSAEKNVTIDSGKGLTGIPRSFIF